MNLKIFELSRILLDTKVRKVIAEDFNGYFGLLPRHIDFITGLAPGILTYEQEDGNIRYAALNEGVLVKTGPDIFVSTSRAILGYDLPGLEDLLQKEFLIEDERERKVRTAAARLEADLARRFMRFGRQYYA
jgi:F-type H+-transporting ATPase subunit epsilon